MRIVSVLKLMMWTVVFLTCTVRAAEVWVDCASGGSIQNTLNSLPAPPPGEWNSVVVQGPCNENITISGQHRLWLGSPLWGGDYPMATITGVRDSAGNAFPVISISDSRDIQLSRLILTGGRNGLVVENRSVVGGHVIRAEGNIEEGIKLADYSMLFLQDGRVIGNGNGVANDPNNWAPSGIFLSNYSYLQIEGKTPWLPPISGHEPFVISGNAGCGIEVNNSTLLALGGVHILDNLTGAGIKSDWGGLSIGSWTGEENLIRGNPIGISLFGGATMSMWGSNTVRNNATAGIAVHGGSAAVISKTASGAVTIEGNLVAGVEVTTHSEAILHGTAVRNNGSTTEPLRAGIWADGTSQVSLLGVNEVTGNTGPGIAADIGSSLDITDATITNNTEEGIRLKHLSIAEIQGTTTVESNGAGPLTCDKSSWAITGMVLKDVKCANIETVAAEKKPKSMSVTPPTLDMKAIMQRGRSRSERFKNSK